MVNDLTKQGVIWIKGFSASGKTTVARKVEFRLKQGGYKIIALDGDELRNIFGDKWGHDKDSREELASAYFRLCSHLSSQGFTVVISAVAMFDTLETWVRTQIPNAMQVFLDVPMNERLDRDANTKRIFLNKNTHDSLYDLPKCSDIVVANYGEVTPDIAAKEIVEKYYSFNTGEIDRDRSKHWKEYYAKDIAPSNPSSYAEKVVMQIKKGQHILDIGCGNRRDSIFFSGKGVKVDAIDRSKDAIDLCRRKYISSTINFSSGDVTHMANKGVKYDNIYCRFVIHAMPVSEEIDLIQTSFDLLKKGGCIFIECRSINDPLSRKGEVLSPTERFYGHYRRFIIPYELDSRLVEEGFEVLEISEYNGVSRYDDDNPVVVRVTAIKR